MKDLNRAVMWSYLCFEKAFFITLQRMVWDLVMRIEQGMNPNC